MCVEHAIEKSNSVEANYIYVDGSKASIGGIKLNPTRAVMYSCKSLVIE